mmetsp:Transcript_27914/g.41162  ORF Transcript_27914/g.41162 Transcript_27914/m.41162 type:complete len:1196 (+) Transcript_27914:66-3653(+)
MSGFGERVPPGALQQKSSSEKSRKTNDRMLHPSGNLLGVTGDQHQSMSLPLKPNRFYPEEDTTNNLFPSQRVGEGHGKPPFGSLSRRLDGENNESTHAETESSGSSGITSRINNTIFSPEKKKVYFSASGASKRKENTDFKQHTNMSESMDIEDENDSGRADEAKRESIPDGSENGESLKDKHEAEKNSGANSRSQGRTRSSSIDERDTHSEEGPSDRGERTSIGAEQNTIATNDKNNRDLQAFGMSSLKESSKDSALTGRLPPMGSGVKEPSGAMATTASFLDALSEEERRVRTRHLPAVEGIRRLHRSEIKKDLALARSMNGIGNLSSSGKSVKGKRGGSSTSAESNSDKKIDLKTEDRRMDIDDEGTGASDEETTSDISGGGGRALNKLSGAGDAVEIGPCSAFLPPKDDVLSMISGGKNASTGENSDNGASADGQVRSHPPHVVQSITAFNPPRPKESIGSKKKHRLIRWERNPQVVEVELSNHRKTVQRVREELHNIERERERVEAIGSHLRVHFTNHLKGLREESIALNQELSSIQVDCVKAAELLTSKTRSRGVGKGSHVMRDVLSVLKTRGTKLAPQPGTGTFPTIGAGRLLKNGRKIQGHSWTLPGDKVSTPLGDAVVLHVFGPSVVDVNAPNPEGISFKSKTINIAAQVKKTSPFSSFMHKTPLSMHPGTAHRHGFGGIAPSILSNQQRPVQNLSTNLFNHNQHHTNRHAMAAPNPPGQGFGSGSKESIMPVPKSSSINAASAQGHQQKDTPVSPSVDKSKGSTKQTKHKLRLLHPRICVRTSFGIAYLSPSDVTSLEDPSTYTDQKLLSRWKKMVESAKKMGSCLESDELPFGTCQTLGISSRMITSSATQSGNINMDVNRARKDGITSMHFDSKEEVTNCADVHSFYEEDSEIRKPADGYSKDLTDAKNGHATGQNNNRNGEKNRQKSKGVAPLGAGMLPTPGIYGGLLAALPLDVLEKNLDQTIMNSGGVLGKPSNPCVPPVFKQWEEQRYDIYQLKGKVLQLRNELHRQRKIRHVNERSYSAGKERSERVEGLLLEMKADLKSLKDRLQDELEELGIDQEKAEDMLGAHWNDQDYDGIEDESYRGKQRPDDSVMSGSGGRQSDDNMEGIIVPGGIENRRGNGEYTYGDSRLVADTSQLNHSSEHSLENDISRKSHKRGRNDGDSSNSLLESGSKSKRSFRR